MHVLDHVRWHVILALGGAMLIPWFSWQPAALAVGTIALEHGIRTGYQHARRQPAAVSAGDLAREDAPAQPPAQ